MDFKDLLQIWVFFLRMEEKHIYAYFDKYMITAVSWAFAAYVMADDSIEEVDCY